MGAKKMEILGIWDSVYQALMSMLGKLMAQTSKVRLTWGVI